MRRISLFIHLCLVCATALVAQTNYYETVEGLKKVELKRALHDIIQPLQVLKYGSGKGRTWDGFWQADRMNDSIVRDRYSDSLFVFNLNDTTASIKTMNIEHIWANSWWGHVVNNAYCDLFNLYPAEKYANIAKSNNPIGEVTGTITFDNGVIKRGLSTSYRTDSLITVWEPADQWKGDFARTYFYMATCYSDLDSLWITDEGWLTADMSEWPTLKPWVYNLMLKWARLDPVDSIEINRNEVIYHIQGNRNPFVDLPSLSEYIWGTMVDSIFHADAVIVVPVDPIEIEPEVEDFFEDFEAASKREYAENTITATAASWTMTDALIGLSNNDRFNDARGVRMKSGGVAVMTEDYAEGCDSLYFYSGLYGTDKGATLSVYYSTDSGENWEPVAENLAVGEWQQYGYKLGVEGDIRLRFICSGMSGKRINLDDVLMTHYVAEPSVIKGDVDGNGEIEQADVDMLVAILLGNVETYDEQTADVNEDGRVSLADLTALINLVCF